MIAMPDNNDLGPRRYCLSCLCSWRSKGSDETCFACGEPGELGRLSAPPAGWPTTSGAPVAVEPRAS